MLSALFMKILETRPSSYDQRMARLTRGYTTELKQSVAREAEPGERVLEVGCGTGELAEMMASRGAWVQAFDPSPGMVAVARQREVEGLEVHELGIEGMDTLAEGGFDLVVATLVLSELSPEERSWTLHQAHRVLRPAGRLVLADEVVPPTRSARLAQAAARLPMATGAWLVAGSITHPLADLPGEVRAAGFAVDEVRLSHRGAFVFLRAHHPQEAPCD